MDASIDEIAPPVNMIEWHDSNLVYVSQNRMVATNHVIL